MGQLVVQEFVTADGFAAGEVDAVRLVVMPVAIGAGRGVFPAGQDPTLLALLSAKTYDAGLIELEYSLRAGW
jgi:dihydrofolate reductase